MPGYRAMPATGGPFPVILVVQEIFGLHEWIKDVCRRLAKAGYYAIAPSLYERQGDATKVADTQALIRDIVSKCPTRKSWRDLDAAVAFAKASGSADTSKLGVTGFCWGGRIVWMYAGHNPALKAAVAWYGPVSRSYRCGRQDGARYRAWHSARRCSDSTAATIPVSRTTRREKIGDAMKAAGKTCEFVVYPETPHGFHADYRPSYRKEEAEDGWTGSRTGSGSISAEACVPRGRPVRLR